MPANYLELFQTLARPTEASAFWAQPFPGFSDHRLAKTSSGDAGILVRTPGSGDGAMPLPVHLESLTVEFDKNCVVQRPDGRPEQDIYAVIICTSRDLLMVDYFLHCAAAMLAILGEAPSRSSVGDAIQKFIRLFRALAAPPRDTVQGLWAELYLILEASDIEVLAGAWHSSPDERFDFSGGSQRVEVKSSGRRDRNHHFSLSQLEYPPSVKMLVASIHTERSSGGLTLGDLLRSVAGRLSPNLATRVRETAMETLGNLFEASLHVAFDRELARSSIRYYPGENIPRILLPVPVAVSEVRFTADLGEVATAAVGAEPGLFAALPLP